MAMKTAYTLAYSPGHGASLNLRSVVVVYFGGGFFEGGSVPCSGRGRNGRDLQHHLSKSVQLIYRDLVLACPACWMARAAHKKSYVGKYDMAPAQHACDTTWVLFFPSTPPLLPAISAAAHDQPLSLFSGIPRQASKAPVPNLPRLQRIRTRMSSRMRVPQGCLRAGAWMRSLCF
jgi:hypothetical protein